MRRLAGEWLGTLIELIPEIARATGPVPYERVGSELEHRKSLEALASFLDRLADEQPVLLVVEDLQHAGASTIEALHFLATRWERGRILAVATERTERTDEHPSGTSRLRDVAFVHELGPLPEAAVAELVHNYGLAHDVGKLYEWTGGSPLFVTELLRHPASGTAALAIPGSLHDMVARRLTHAGEDVNTLLAQGAVLGSSFSLDDVAALAGIDVEDCARRAARALRAGLLVARGDRFRFPNDIVRTVAYDAVPEPIRVSRHRRAARLVDARPEAAARHLAAARDWVEAARAWQLAAHAAHLAFANDEAERLLTDALGVAELSADRALLAVLRLRRGEIRTELGRHDAARDDHEHALVLARELGDEELEARVLEQLGWTAFYARDVLGAVDLAERATQLAESAAAAKGALPSATLLLGRVRHWDGDYAGAGAAYDRVLGTETVEGTTAMALAYQGALLQHQDRFADARAVLERAAVLCRRTGQFRPLLQTLFFIGLARGDVGDFGGGLASLDRARALIDGYGVSFYRAGIETTTSWLWQELGDVGRAREHAEQAVELARRGGGALELEQELHALLALADCDLLLGRHDDAGARVEAAAPCSSAPCPSGLAQRCGCWRCGPGSTAPGPRRCSTTPGSTRRPSTRRWRSRTSAAARRPPGSLRARARTCWSAGWARPPTGPPHTIGSPAPCPSSSARPTPALPRDRSAPAERSLRSDHRYLSGACRAIIVPERDVHPQVREADVLLDATAAGPTEAQEEALVRRLHVSDHPRSAPRARDGDGEPHQWATEAGGAMCGQHGEPVALPQPVAERVEPDRSGGSAIDESQDVHRGRLAVADVAVRADEDPLLDDEHLVSDAVVLDQVGSVLGQPTADLGRRAHHAGHARAPGRDPICRSGLPRLSSCCSPLIPEQAWQRAHPATAVSAPMPRSVRYPATLR